METHLPLCYNIILYFRVGEVSSLALKPLSGAYANTLREGKWDSMWMETTHDL
jgi:hypothetical protein